METALANALGIFTARQGSSMSDKNLIPLIGRPCACYGIDALAGSKEILKNFVSTDDPRVEALAIESGLAAVERPPELATDTASHGDVLKDFLDKIRAPEMANLEILVVVLGNAPVICSQWIDGAISMLQSSPEASAVIPVIGDDDHHPFRGYWLDEKSQIEPVFNSFRGFGRPASNRQQLPRVVFPAHNFWALRLREGALDVSGDGPWPYFGRTPRALQLDVERVDIHTAGDIPVVEREIARLRSEGLIDEPN